MGFTKNGIYQITVKISYAKRIVSFLLLTLAGFLVVYTFVVPFTSYYDKESYNPIAGLLVALFPLIAGVVVGTKKRLMIDTVNNRFQIEKTALSMVYNTKIKLFKSIDYISLFRNYTGFYEARLFYNETEYIEIFEMKNEEKALYKVEQWTQGLSIPIHNLIINDYWQDKEAPKINPEDREISAFLSEGERPFWQTVLASVFYTVCIFCLYLFASEIINFGTERIDTLRAIIELAGISGAMGVGSSLVKDYKFDFKNNHYKIIYRIGPIKYGTWKLIRRLEYISLHEKRKKEYHLNIWYNKSKHINVGIYGNYDAALTVGIRISEKFKVDLLNSAHPEGKKWRQFTENTNEN